MARPLGTTRQNLLDMRFPLMARILARPATKLYSLVSSRIATVSGATVVVGRRTAGRCGGAPCGADEGGRGRIEEFAISQGVPSKGTGLFDNVCGQGPGNTPRRAVVKEHTHQRPETGASRLLAANSRTALTCARDTGNCSITSSIAMPSSRFSKTTATGVRVPLNTQAPLTLPGTLSTAGHSDQSSHRLCHLRPFVVGREPPAVAERATGPLCRFPRVQAAIATAILVRAVVTIGGIDGDLQILRHPLFAIRHSFGGVVGCVLAGRGGKRRGRANGPDRNRHRDYQDLHSHWLRLSSSAANCVANVLPEQGDGLYLSERGSQLSRTLLRPSSSSDAATPRRVRRGTLPSRAGCCAWREPAA
jgi:hypothetical protein